MQRLAASDQRLMTEDLSEEIPAPQTAPPSLDMPKPRLMAMVADEEETDPRTLTGAIEAYAKGEGTHPLPADFGAETITTLTDRSIATPGGTRRRRRSLLKKKRPT